MEKLLWMENAVTIRLDERTPCLIWRARAPLTQSDLLRLNILDTVQHSLALFAHTKRRYPRLGYIADLTDENLPAPTLDWVSDYLLNAATNFHLHKLAICCTEHLILGSDAFVEVPTHAGLGVRLFKDREVAKKWLQRN